jgi:ubiquitin carboxyl-terminal hydrolase 8
MPLQFASSHPQSMAGYTGAYNGQPLIPSHLPTGSSRYSSNYSSSPDGGPKPPPPVSANASPGPLSRRRSDYLEQHNQPYTGYMDRSSRPSTVTYPNLSQPQMPPPAASSGSSRQETRPQPPRSESIISFDGLSKLPDQDDMLYWSDVALGISGLKNLGKLVISSTSRRRIVMLITPILYSTCYMNSTLQCLSATYPLARFFRGAHFPSVRRSDFLIVF